MTKTKKQNGAEAKSREKQKGQKDQNKRQGDRKYIKMNFLLNLSSDKKQKPKHQINKNARKLLSEITKNMLYVQNSKIELESLTFDTIFYCKIYYFIKAKNIIQIGKGTNKNYLSCVKRIKY